MAVQLNWMVGRWVLLGWTMWNWSLDRKCILGSSDVKERGKTGGGGGGGGGKEGNKKSICGTELGATLTVNKKRNIFTDERSLTRGSNTHCTVVVISVSQSQGRYREREILQLLAIHLCSVPIVLLHISEAIIVPL